jgi:hypothetical protein
MRGAGPASLRLLLQVTAALSLGISFAHGQSDSLDLALAREPALVTTTAKREFRGLLDGFRDGRLFIRAATGGGEVGYSFARDEIAKLQLPGTALEAEIAELWDRGEIREALPRLEALGRQRLRYLPVLNETQRAPLRRLVAASAQFGNPLATLGYVNQLRAVFTADADRALLRDAELDAHLQLGQRDEIRRLATAWCAESDPGGASALGWKILAQLAYDEGDFATARRVALQPIVFSGYLPMEHLEACYALAIGAARKLNDEGHAVLLESEAAERGMFLAAPLASEAP